MSAFTQLCLLALVICHCSQRISASLVPLPSSSNKAFFSDQHISKQQASAHDNGARGINKEVLEAGVGRTRAAVHHIVGRTASPHSRARDSRLSIESIHLRNLDVDRASPIIDVQLLSHKLGNTPNDNNAPCTDKASTTHNRPSSANASRSSQAHTRVNSTTYINTSHKHLHRRAIVSHQLQGTTKLAVMMMVSPRDPPDLPMRVSRRLAKLIHRSAHMCFDVVQFSVAVF